MADGERQKEARINAAQELKTRLRHGFDNPVVLEGEEICISCLDLVWREVARIVDDFIFETEQ